MPDIPSDIPSDWEFQFDETFDGSDTAWECLFDAHVGLCPGPSQAQGPISSGRPNFESKSGRTIDNFFNPTLDVGSSDPGLSSFLDVNFDFNSNLDHGN